MSYIIDGAEHSVKKMVSRDFGIYHICYPESFSEKIIEDIMESHFDNMCKILGYENVRKRLEESFIEITLGQSNGKIMACKELSVLEKKVESQTSTTV